MNENLIKKINIDTEEFHLKYVEPFYLKLMSLNFLSAMPSIKLSEVEILKFLSDIKSLAQDLDDEVVASMVNYYWRVSKVGAWIVGLDKREQLIDVLLNQLKSSSEIGVCHVEHILLNILIIDEKRSSQIMLDFIHYQVDYLLNCQFFRLDIEKSSIDWAINILQFLDDKYGKRALADVYASDYWKRFENRIRAEKFFERYIDSYLAIFQPKSDIQNKLARMQDLLVKISL